MNGTWENNWLAFADELERKLQSGATPEELARCFGGRQVKWNGTVEQVDFDELAAIVDVALPNRVVTLEDGGQSPLDGLTLAVAEASTEKWRGLSTGDDVTFVATLGEAGSPFSPIEVKTLKSGESIIMIRVSNAIPLV
jgi:hypothetical protein